MADLDTTIDGSPESIRTVARALQRTFGDQAEEMADVAFNGRRSGIEGWEGAAGEAFGARAKALAQASDSARATALVAGRNIDDLADALDTAQRQMLRIRREAAGAGLTVTGAVVKDPGARLRVTGSLPPDPTPQEVQQARQVERQVAQQNAKVDAFETAVSDAGVAVKAWADAISRAALAQVRWDKELVGLTASLLGVEGEIATGLQSTRAAARAEVHAARARAAQAHVDHWTATGVYDREHFYAIADEAMDEARAARAESLRSDLMGPDGKAAQQAASAVRSADDPLIARDASLAKAASDGKALRAFGRTATAVGVLATGYSIKEDMEEGESVAQATASNGGGMVASMLAGGAAGAQVGALVGTAIPVPGVGTVAGAVTGAVVGTVAGAFTSGAIDSVFSTHGVHSVDDVGTAIVSGWGEVVNTGTAIGSAAGDVAEAVGDAWSSLFD